MLILSIFIFCLVTLLLIEVDFVRDEVCLHGLRVLCLPGLTNQLRAVVVVVLDHGDHGRLGRIVAVT